MFARQEPRARAVGLSSDFPNTERRNGKRGEMKREDEKESKPNLILDSDDWEGEREEIAAGHG